MGIFKPKNQKQIVDKNGVSTTRWVNDENIPTSLGKERILPRVTHSLDYEIDNSRRYRDAEELAREAERKLRDELRTDYIEITQPVKTSPEAKTLWLALHLAQGGETRSIGYNREWETPTIDADVDFPVGYGANAVHSLVIESLTPTINTEGASGDRRSGWEHGHGATYVLKSNNGILSAETNVRSGVYVTAAELKAAKALSSAEIVNLAKSVYSDHGVEEKATDVLGSLYKFRKNADKDARERALYGAKSRSTSSAASIPSSPSRASRSRDRDEDDDSSFGRATRDPFGFSDPLGVRDPGAALIRDAMGTNLFGGSGGFGSD